MFRNLALQSNYQQGNLKVCLLIKSGYYIVPNPSTTLPIIFYNCSSLFDWNKGMSCFIYRTWVTISKTTSLWNLHKSFYNQNWSENFLWGYWILAKNLSNFVSLCWKLDNPDTKFRINKRVSTQGFQMIWILSC